MLAMQDTPATGAIHPAKALLCVGRILCRTPMRVVGPFGNGVYIEVAAGP
jgi:hypothetical protein